jgi:hypothetical protein
MATVKVIHKTRAYIGGRTYDPGEEAEIDEKDFNESTHAKAEDAKPLDKPAKPLDDHKETKTEKADRIQDEKDARR